MASPQLALLAARKALDETPLDHTERARRLNNLVFELGESYEATANLAQLSEAISLGRNALLLLPLSHPHRAGHLMTLGLLLGLRFGRTGDNEDLEAAIGACQDALHEPDSDEVPRSGILINLAMQYHTRYQIFKSLADLEEAIRLVREALSLIADDKIGRINPLNNLSVMLSSQGWRKQDIGILDEAVQTSEEAVALSRDHKSWADVYNNLAQNLGHRARFSKTRSLSDINRAIRIVNEVITSVVPESSSRRIYYNHLASLYDLRYARTKDPDDLDNCIDAIDTAIEASDEISEDHSDKAGLLNRLAFALFDKAKLEDDMDYYEESIDCSKSALLKTNAYPSARLVAGKAVLFHSADIMNMEDAYEASQTIFSLIPRLTPRAQDNSDKQDQLKTIAGLASDAAATALWIDKQPYTALDLLEQGRGIIANSLEEKRQDLTELQAEFPDLAEQFVTLSDTLYRQTEGDLGSGLSQNKERAFEDLLGRIRSQSGFEHFLKSPSEGQMKAAAGAGPIAVINVSMYRCDALIIKHDEIKCIALKDLRIEDVNLRVKEDRLEDHDTLRWLWDAVTAPVLDFLDFRGPTTDETRRPHIWWIPTGPLCRFPRHASGYPDLGSGKNALDRVVSSYAMSVKTLLSGRLVVGSGGAQALPRRAVLVAVEHTPNHLTSLPNAIEEISAVEAICTKMGFVTTRPEPMKSNVLAELARSNIFHFAGHGDTDATDPLASQLLLHDWEENRLTVNSLLNINLRQHAPFLAYLSACGTGRIRADQMYDESLHLISACQLAGYRHVIGTLWEVDDTCCAEVASIVYNHIKDRGLNDASVAQGLNLAARIVRDRSSVHSSKTAYGDRSKRSASAARLDADKDSESNLRRLIPVADDKDHSNKDTKPAAASTAKWPKTQTISWVPYVHFGV